MTMIFFSENMQGMIKYKRNRSGVFSDHVLVTADISKFYIRFRLDLGKQTDYSIRNCKA